jgi:hypothetical protein
VHTIGAKHTSFDVTIDGRTSSLDELMPDLGDDDRLAVVVRSALGGVGCSALVLAMVRHFYVRREDDVRALAPGEILYPEHFVVHVDRARGDYAWLDFWPPDKEMVVAGASVPQTLLDLGITRLLVEDGAPNGSLGHVDLERQLITCLAFSPTGRTARADVTVAGNPSAEQWVGWTIDPERAAQESDRPSAQSSDRLLRASEVTDTERDEARRMRAGLIEDDVPIESYRRITSREAVCLLMHDP